MNFSSFVAAYADYFKFYSKDITSLIDDIEKLKRWSGENEMKINFDKYVG